MIPDLYFIVDTECGLGHKSRCMAIEEEWLARGGTTHWSWGVNPPSPVVVIFDGYQLQDRRRKGWRDSGNLVVTIDDIGGKFTTDILINYCSRWMRVPYEIEGLSESGFLGGPKYFPLRRHYREVREVPIIENGLPFDCDSVNRAIEPFVFARMVALSKYIICGAAVKAYEALYLNKPVLLKMLAENQRHHYDSLTGLGYALPYNKANVKAFDNSQAMRDKYRHGRSLVDGLGVQRIVDSIIYEFGVKFRV